MWGCSGFVPLREPHEGRAGCRLWVSAPAALGTATGRGSRAEAVVLPLNLGLGAEGPESWLRAPFVVSRCF